MPIYACFERFQYVLHSIKRLSKSNTGFAPSACNCPNLTIRALKCLDHSCCLLTFLFPMIFLADHRRNTSNLPSPPFEAQVQSPMAILVILHVKLPSILLFRDPLWAVV